MKFEKARIHFLGEVFVAVVVVVIMSDRTDHHTGQRSLRLFMNSAWVFERPKEFCKRKGCQPGLRFIVLIRKV